MTSCAHNTVLTPEEIELLQYESPGQGRHVTVLQLTWEAIGMRTTPQLFSPLLENIKYSNEVPTRFYQVSIKLLFLKIIYITSAAPMADLNAEQPSPSQTPTSTASDGADEAPLEIRNTPIVTRSMLSEIMI